MFFKNLLFENQSRNFPDTVYSIIIQKKNQKYFPIFSLDKRIILEKLDREFEYSIGIVPRTLTDFKIPVYFFSKEDYPNFLGIEIEYSYGLKFMYKNIYLFSLLDDTINVDNFLKDIKKILKVENIEIFPPIETRMKLLSFNKIFIKEFLL